MSVWVHVTIQNMLFILLLKVHEIEPLGALSGLLLVSLTCAYPLCVSVCMHAWARVCMCVHGWMDACIPVYKVCPESIQPCIWKQETFTEEDTRYKKHYTGQWQLSPLQSRHLGTSHNPPNHHQPSRSIFLNLINSLNLFPFKGDFSFGKSQKLQDAKSWL